MENTRTDSHEMRLTDSTANPGPLGLLAFGMTTILLNIHNLGLFELNSMILGMGAFFGGMAQMVAGAREWKKGNTFAATAFSAYGAFWISFVALLVLPHLGLAEASSAFSMGFYLLTWGVFTGCMFIGTLRLNKALQVVFGSLTILFLLLAIKDFTEIAVIGTVAGAVGIFCGGSAFYTGIAEVLNEVYGSVVLPLGPVKR